MRVVLDALIVGALIAPNEANLSPVLQTVSHEHPTNRSLAVSLQRYLSRYKSVPPPIVNGACCVHQRASLPLAYAMARPRPTRLHSSPQPVVRTAISAARTSTSRLPRIMDDVNALRTSPLLLVAPRARRFLLFEPIGIWAGNAAARVGPRMPARLARLLHSVPVAHGSERRGSRGAMKTHDGVPSIPKPAHRARLPALCRRPRTKGGS
jgi:hypothetical protein